MVRFSGKEDPGVGMRDKVNYLLTQTVDLFFMPGITNCALTQSEDF
ncbi:MAG TPA: hypothetical protein PK941_10265 [Paludibacter sp.]|jgi:hypothetical protein|nr:hypothetical protein [Paludibacter sp.]